MDSDSRESDFLFKEIGRLSDGLEGTKRDQLCIGGDIMDIKANIRVIESKLIHIDQSFSSYMPRSEFTHYENLVLSQQKKVDSKLEELVGYVLEIRAREMHKVVVQQMSTKKKQFIANLCFGAIGTVLAIIYELMKAHVKF